MAYSPSNDPSELLTQQELESLNLAQEIYGARAKQAADEFGRVLELDDEGRGQLVGQVALKLAELDFEARRELALRFTELVSVLGASATEATGTHIGEVVPIFPVITERPQDRTVTEDGIDKNGKTTEDLSIIPLGRDQRRWLLKVFPDEAVEQLEQMPKSQRIDIVQRLTDFYMTVNANKGWELFRQSRSEEVMALMHGKDVSRLAAHESISRNTMHSRLHQFAERIADKLDEQTKIAILRGEVPEIPSAGEPTSNVELKKSYPENQDPEKEQTILNRLALKWFGKLYDEAVAKKLGGSTREQVDAVVDAVAERYVSLKIPRLNPELKQTRIRQLKETVSGIDIKDIAQESGVSPDAVTDGLMNMAAGIKKRIPREELVAMIPDELSDSEPPINLEERTEILEPRPLDKDQLRWFQSLIEDDAVAEINDMNFHQQEHLAIRLSQLLIPAIVRKLGPERTQSRVVMMLEFVTGKAVAEIALSQGITEEAVRDVLYHARNRLKSETSKEKLIVLVAEAQNFVPEKD
jgi:hypothetical protein